MRKCREILDLRDAEESIERINARYDEVKEGLVEHGVCHLVHHRMR
jgi:hypothetical protein